VGTIGPLVRAVADGRTEKLVIASEGEAIHCSQPIASSGLLHPLPQVRNDDMAVL
jgi:hypothetical protein